MNVISTIYNKLVVGNQKAIVAFVLSAAAVWLLAVGVTLQMTVGEALQILVVGALNAVGVWLKRNR